MRARGLLPSFLPSFLVACVPALLPACATTLAPVAAADIALVGGRVHTLEPGRPPASAVAMRDGRILAVGSDAQIVPVIGPRTQVVELGGRPVYPGFSDSHLHLADLGQALMNVDLVGTRSYDEVVALAAARAAELPPGAWVRGRGWDQNDWDDTDFPDHGSLSEAVPDRPVVLTRIDGHAVLANAAALAAAGITARTAEPQGGRILRRRDGSPTGVLVDNATALVERHIPPSSEAEVQDGVRRAIDVLHAYGITAVHDAGISLHTAELYADLARQDAFDLRVHVMLSDDEPALRRQDLDLPTADLTGQGRIAVRAIKVSVDGALGSRGAAMLDDYSDEPGHDGLVTTSAESLAATAELALRAGWQVCTHAIGDRGNRMVLDVYEAALAAVPPAERAFGERAPRFRIEHAQILAPEDIPRFAALDVIPSMQAQHQTSDMPWAEQRVGPERVAGAYAWRSLLDTGVPIAGGSDAPVERPDPMAAFHAAVTRQDERGLPPGGWYPAQAMTRAEALDHLTRWPAFAAFDEARLGTIERGKLADLVVLEDDLLTAPLDRLAQLRVDMTIFDGRIVYARSDG